MSSVPAEFNKTAFNCPNCGAYAKQTWTPVFWLQPHPQNATQRYHAQVPSCVLAVCDHCNQFSIWLNGKLVHPLTMTAPLPHPDTPDSIKGDYEEARAVYQQSPRSSAALLRLAIQKVCIE